MITKNVRHNGPMYNTDEDLFSDANRPRDEFGRKIVPGLQMDKLDFRKANKNISMGMAQLVVKGGSMVQGTPSKQKIIWTPPILKEKWTKREYNNIGFPFVIDDDNIEALQQEKFNNPCAILRQGNMKYLTGKGVYTDKKTIDGQRVEILKSGLYIVQASGQFYFPDPPYDSEASYKYKERVAVAQEINGTFQPINFSVFRACGNGDDQMSWQISRFKAGTKLTSMAAHSFLEGDTFVGQTLNVVRLQ